MREIPAKGSNAIISKTQTFSETFNTFLQSIQNFAHFEKKDLIHSLDLSEVIDPEKCGYFNARKLLV